MAATDEDGQFEVPQETHPELHDGDDVTPGIQRVNLEEDEALVTDAATVLPPLRGGEDRRAEEIGRMSTFDPWKRLLDDGTRLPEQLESY